ncbi:hypothetical protein, partial [Thiolapillus sp.]|uniref:hypothetical protein n=1 Tax=Thiolapillus sp. TaxID=2017437 RepID=UPI003AF865A8
MPKGLDTVLPVVLAPIGRSFERLEKRLRGRLNPVLRQRTHRRTEFIHGVSFGWLQCCVRQEGCEPLFVASTQVGIVLCTLKERGFE